MGIFSSKKKTVVDTAVVRVIEDSQVPSSMQKAVLTSLFTKRRLVNTVSEALMGSPARNFERMYRWAKEGNYFYGLPDARVLTTSDGIQALQNTLNFIEGRAVDIVYGYFRPINNVHVAWEHLTEYLGYDHQTNELVALSIDKGYPVFLEGMVVHYSTPLEEMDSSAVGIWERNPNAWWIPGRPLNIDAAIQGLTVGHEYVMDSVEGVTVKITWEIPAERDEDGLVVTPGRIEQEEFFLSLADFDLDAEYFQAKYTYEVGDTLVTKYFTYLPGDGTYPELDNVYALNYVAPGTYFPFVVFRREKTNRAEPWMQGTPEYESTKELLEFINMDFQQMSDDIHANPDISDVEQAVLMMGVPITSQDQVDIKYMIRFFDSIMEKVDFATQDFIATHANYSSDGIEEGYAVEIADADFRAVFSLDGIISTVKAGTLGPVGTCTNTSSSSMVSILKIPVGQEIRILRQQITSHAYREIRVINPKIRYDIFEGKGTVGAGEDDRCLIPLDYALCRKMPLMERERLYYRSLHLVANSRVTMKVRWYETGIFKAVLVIAAVAISFLTGGTTAQTIIAAASAGASALVMTILEIVITQLITGYLVTVAATEVAQLLGPELAALVAAAAIIYGGYKAYQSGGIVVGSTAEKLISAGNGLAKGTSNALRGMMQDLQNEMNEFREFQASKIAELDKFKEEMGLLTNVDPFVANNLYPVILFGESPSRYFNRSIHAGNIGPRSMDVVRNYVDMALSLPTIQDTIGTPLPQWMQ